MRWIRGSRMGAGRLGGLVLAALVWTAGAADRPIRLQWGNLDPAEAGAQARMKSLRQGKRLKPVQRASHRGTVPWLVQFHDVVREEWKEALEAEGAVLRGYIPENAFLIEAAPGVLRRIAARPEVKWVGEYEPGYKQAKAVRHALRTAPEEAREYRVLLFDPTDADRLENAVRDLPGAAGVAKGRLADRGLIRARLTGTAVEALSQWGEVEWVEPVLDPRPWNDVAVRENKMNVSNAWSVLGLSGAGQTIAVCDSGLDTGDPATLHPDFTNRVTGYAWDGGVYNPIGSWADTRGHGTHVAGSALGSGFLSGGQFKGVAYEADLVMQGVGWTYGGIPYDLTTLLRQAFTNGARIHSNSWGYDDNGTYSSQCRSLDMYVWSNKTMLVVVAAGNSGEDADADGVVDLGSVGSPATAKNCLTVGAAESYRTVGGHAEDTWSEWYKASLFPADPIQTDLVSSPDSPQGMAAFSGRGPCNDGRIKPDIVAPGTDILSTRSRVSTNVASGEYLANTNYHYAGGTSMATPLTAGSAALAREWLADSRGITNPSAALVKALLLSGARNMAPGQYGTGAAQEIPQVRPSPVQGWGHVDLYGTLQPADGQSLELSDTNSLATGETNVFTLTVSAPNTNRAVVTLAYSDYWPALGAGKQLVNDLDLTVRKPGGTVLYANGGTNLDDLNNVEMIEFAPDESGTYEIRVAGRTVPEGGSQDYALVIRGTPPVAPVFTALGVQTAEVGVATGFTVQAAGDPAPVLAFAGTTAAGTSAFTAATGVLDYEPAAGDAGPRTFTFTASNSVGVATQVVDVTVLPGGQVITFPAVGAQTTTSEVQLAAAASSGLPVSYAVADGPGILDGDWLYCTGTGTVTVVASQAGNGSWNPAPDVTQAVAVTAGGTGLLELSRSAVNVREGGTGRLYVRLTAAPAASVLVVTEWRAGDTNLAVTAGAARIFTPANWSEWQDVTLGAPADANAVGETAVFRLTADGAAETLLGAAALDDDIGENLALPAGGTLLSSSGASQPALVVDGIHDEYANRGYTRWTRVPPGWIQLDLLAPSELSRIRVQNWDWNHRLNRYRIEGSLDGTNWTVVADASDTDCHGWDDWDLGGATWRHLRLTGLSNSVNFAVIFSEWEVFGVRGVIREEQAVTFPAIDDQWVTNTVGLAATASSGLPVEYEVETGPAVVNGTNLSFTGEGLVTVTAGQSGNTNWLPAEPVSRSFEVLSFSSILDLSRTNVWVREDGEGRFFVRLRKAPSANVTVEVARVSGATNLAVVSGGSQVITPGTWDIWRVVTLAAGGDTNDVGETASFQVTGTGEGTAQRTVAAAVLESEEADLLDLAGDGATVTGYLATRPELLIDGIHTNSGNYAHTIWNNTPPGWMTIDLQTPVDISSIRLLNWDWSHRLHRYRIDGSADGVTWTLLADAEADPRHGWDRWEPEADPVRYLRFTGLSNTANGAVCIAELEVCGTRQAVETEDLLETDVSQVNVREDGAGRFFVRLKEAPAAAMTVTVSRVSGSGVLAAAAPVYFATNNWDTWRVATLTAAADADATNDTAVFELTMPGADPVQVTATALDDDIGPNVALATNGTTVSGYLVTRPELVNDGIHDNNGNYAHTIWNNTPPGWMTLDLQASVALTRMRILNWDWSYRVHRYRVEASADGTNWTLVADASAEARHGWDDWALDGTSYRYLRFTGLSNSANGAVCIPEWEVYTAPAPTAWGSGGRSSTKADAFASLTARGSEAPLPVTVLTSDGPEDETGWLALDGLPETAWIGQQPGGGYIVIGYEPELELEAFEVDMAPGSLTGFETLYSLDGEEWGLLGEALLEGPVELTYLWIVFPDDGTDAVPEVLEIRTNP